MRTHRIPRAATAALLALGAAVQLVGAAPTEFAGRLIGPRGAAPPADAVIGRMWTWTTDSATPQGPSEITVDADGAFHGSIETYGRPVVLMAYADEHRLAGMIRVEPGATTGLELTLAPAARVTGRLDCAKLPSAVADVSVMWMSDRDRPVTSRSDKDGRFVAVLPEGAWRRWVYGRDLKSTTANVDLAAPTTEFGDVPVEASFIALNVGRKVSWKTTDARGVAADRARVEDFSGKWLFVEFWGFW